MTTLFARSLLAAVLNTELLTERRETVGEMNPGGAEPIEPAILLPKRARLGDIGKAEFPAFVDGLFFCRRAGKLVREAFI